MAMIGESHRPCRNDNDCVDTQFCYYVSHLCVDFMKCERYHRLSGKKPARDPVQCGPCMPGYSAEKFENGNENYLCGRHQKDISEAYQSQYQIIMYTVAILAVMMVLGAIGFFIYIKRRLSETVNESIQGEELREVSPTAPPIENSPLIFREVPLSPEQLDDNKNLKDKSNLVRAVGYHPPRWVEVNPNYGNNLANDNAAGPELSANNQLNRNWAPEEQGVEVPDGAIMLACPIEQVDNSLNTILVQANPPTSNATGSNNDNSNSNNSSSSESNNTQGNRERARTPNILISQKISMNWNVNTP